ncbi:MAG: polymorphic toxin-type HINT domain-containing protein, partial [Candidatus Babeliales bacterium]
VTVKFHILVHEAKQKRLRAMMRIFFSRKNVFFGIFFLFLCHGIVLAEGFSPHTTIRLFDGHVALQSIEVGDQLVTFDPLKKREASLGTAAVVDKVSVEVATVIELTVCGETIEVAEDQQFYLPLQYRWLPASKLRTGMQLLGIPFHLVTVQLAVSIERSTNLYRLSLTKPHTYCVGNHGLVTHNFVIAATQSFFSPIFGLACAGAASLGRLVWKGASGFCNSFNGPWQEEGHHTIYLQAKNKNNSKKNSSSKSDSGKNFQNFQNPKNSEDPNKKPEKSKMRRMFEKFASMYEVFRRARIGEELKKNSKPTKFNVHGAKVHQATKNMKDLGVRKNDLFYIDKLHYDHIEVFDSTGENMRTILNMDGTQNLKKLAQAQLKPRDIRQWIQ